MMRRIMLVLIGLLLILPLGGSVKGGGSATGARAQKATSATSTRSVYVIYYWRAKPGKAAEYADYVRTVAEPIDEEARKAGVFEEVHTYTPALVTGAPGADWTHIRIFRLKSFASWDAFSAGMDEATKRVVPDAAQRARNSERAAGLRDLVRQEIWQDFR